MGDVCKGSAFKLNPTTGRFKVLHCFSVDTDGGWLGALIRDNAGNLYGTAEGGGGGVGLVFKLDKSAVFTILYTFTGGSDGGEPTSGLIRDAEGNLYGAANEGGDSKCHYAGCGTVFKLDTTGALTVLHTFHGKDGWFPFGPLARSPNGTLFGTTYEGGDFTCGDGNGCGTVFKVSKTGKETVLHRFNGEDGAYPEAGLIRDKAGNLYGTTYLGGAYGYGTVFQLTANSDGTWTESVLYSFIGGADGGYPYAPVMLDRSGNLYGTASWGGTYRSGVVFKITP